MKVIRCVYKQIDGPQARSLRKGSNRAIADTVLFAWIVPPTLFPGGVDFDPANVVLTPQGGFKNRCRRVLSKGLGHWEIRQSVSLKHRILAQYMIETSTKRMNNL